MAPGKSGLLVRGEGAMQETWVLSLGQEDLLEKEMATYPLQYSSLEKSMDRGAAVHGVTRP